MRDPDRDCPLCPRLSGFLADARREQPDWFNAPVPSFGDPARAQLLIVGLAPGLRGANRTGRPFTGDYAGELLYATLLKHGFARGAFDARIDDGLELIDCLITNAVRCVPPQNKPTPEEIRTCRRFLDATLDAVTALKAIVVLGRIAHDSFLRAIATPLKAAPFAHGAAHAIQLPGGRRITLFDSYHCSRYNTNTGILTGDMFNAVFAAVRKSLDP